jgi:acetyl-CoA acetyltransferase
MSGAGRATVLGIGEADGGRATGRPGVELAAEAVLRALDDADLRLEDVDGLLTEDPDADQHHMSHLALSDVLGFRPGFAASTACGGATPFANVALAVAALETGYAERILVVDYDARQTTRNPDRTKRLARTGGHRDPWADPYGPTTMAKFALVQRAHMAAWGTTREQLARITVSARDNGAQREGAQLRKPVTVQDVLDSPPLAEPIHLLDACVVSDWGSALVVSRPEPGTRRGVDVLGVGQGHQGYAMTRARDLTVFPGIATSARKAFAMAGIEPTDCDLALVYDSFTITVLVALEALGFCPPGHGGPFVASGAIRRDGFLPVNPHGGQLSYSGGHGHFLTEAVRQLRGEAPSAQVPAAELAVCQGTAAGVLSSHTVVLGRQR